jgi:hypothetical protein
MLLGADIAATFPGDPPPAPLPPRPPPQLNHAERAEVEKLRARLTKYKGNPLWEESTTMYRFLIARQDKKGEKDYEASAQMFRNRVAWAAETNLNALWSEFWPPVGIERSPRAEFADQFFYTGFCGVSRTGAPVMVERLGRCDLAGIAGAGQNLVDAMLLCYTIYLERIFRRVRQASKDQQRMVKGVIIVDAEVCTCCIVSHAACAASHMC